MRIVIVEDDHLEEELVRKLLTGNQFRISGDAIETITTEERFRRRIGEIADAQPPPDLVIMDVMMRWTDPAPETPKPPREVEKDGPTRAGLRCAELLDRLNPAIPILFYTILEREDLDTDLFKRRETRGTIEHVRKIGGIDYARKDEDDSELAEKLRHFLPRPSRA